MWTIWPITLIFRIHNATVNTHVCAKFGHNWPSGCWENGIWNKRDGLTDRRTICFYSIEYLIYDQSSWFLVFIKPLTVLTFLLGLDYISQAVAEKWATETLKTPWKAFFYYMKSEPCDRSSSFPGLIKAPIVPTFLPGLVEISQGVAEKWATEWKIVTCGPLFLYDDASDRWSCFF